MSLTRAKKNEQREARERLREIIKPGDTVYTILRHVARSGMSRDISVKVSDGNGGFLHLDYPVAKAIDAPLSKNEGVRIGGCGMDMGFAIVYDLSHALYGNGYNCIGKRAHCPSNVHVNPGPQYYDKRRRHTDGYALKQKWL